ncbi:putative bifunctional diguanylate cyclase/phosphodiesterase [Kineococcus rhizosphaerae]|uniref:Diguanylate cyclase (GGDEF)-like protein n=1 Tax=Kineococcus rhizosphaerae TaxID=559628 RepID=A0A2T0R2D0_9ACTN|nr:bifunctional diguanylate cyclase/phosphodiesterase [Kineococcus rhizosphaerae]PRY13959.1 diguanylate cyclase (GGDEF)-like protein [Kineococcus rhizosphaerae]
MRSPQHARRAALSAAALAVLVPLLLLARARWGEAQHLTVAVGLLALAATVLVPARRPRGSLADLAKHTGAAAVWSTGTALAGLYPTTLVGPVLLSHVAHALSLSGLAVIAVQQLRHARVGGDDQPLLVEAGLYGSVMASTAWDGFARAGYSGDGWWDASAGLVIAVGSLVAAGTIVLAIEHPRLRLSSAGVALGALGTEVSALTSTQQPLTGQVALVAALVGAVAVFAFHPRSGLVRHGGAATARAVRRLRVASVLPATLLLADVAVFVVSPRADGVVFVFFAAVIVAAGLRYAATARAIDRTRDRLSFQALHDQLTGLQNRAALQNALTGPDRTQSLVILEVGGLDDITDVLGVSVGEDVLRAAATNLREHVRALGGSTFRVRHDEFAVLLPGFPDEVVRHLPGAFAAVSAAPLQVPGAGRFPVEAVAGVSRVDPGVRAEGDATLPLVHADLALRDARTTPAGSGYSVYSGAVAAQHARRLLVRERLALAVTEGAVDVHFQPIVDFSTGRVVKFEALARWDDAVLGRVSPVEFIAVAEESNLVVALGEHVLRRAVRSAHAAGVFAAGVRLAVNVSVVQLQSPGFADVVREILSAYRIPPSLLTLELTESVFLDSDSPAERVVTDLAGLGCQIAIDDFGTGYSAFGYLDRLPVHVLKIDRSLTQSLTGEGNGRSVVRTVVDLANRLGLTVVVEGVETHEEASICRSMQAGLGQGWLYSAAVTADRVAAELEREYPVSPEAVR